jgi:dATP/dGTP diphosphohydrolase, N-terminal
MTKPILPTDSKLRKDTPICTGFLDYFPRAAAYVARISVLGNDKHNPGEPLHWAEGKSMDHPDCIVRHVIERGTFDPDDGALHEGKLAWRAMANLETSLKQRELTGRPAWDEEIIAKNKAVLAEKLAEKTKSVEATATQPGTTYRRNGDNYIATNSNGEPYLMPPGWKPDRKHESQG